MTSPSFAATLDEALDHFLAAADRRHRYGGDPTGWAGTLKSHLRRLREHDPQDGGGPLGRRPPEDTTRHHIEAIQSDMATTPKPNGKPYSRGYVRGWRQYTLQAIADLAEDERIPASVADNIAKAKPIELGRSKLTGKPKVSAVPDEELDALIDWCEAFRGDIDDRRLGHPRVVALALRFLRMTGCRPRELATLTLADIRPAPGLRGEQGFRFYQPEYHKTAYKEIERIVVIPPPAVPLLEEAAEIARRGDRPDRLSLEEHADERRLFPWRQEKRVAATAAFRKDVHRCADEAKLPRIAPNRIRHRFGTWGTGVDRKGAQVSLGHSSMTTTDIYDEKEAEASMAMFEQAGMVFKPNTSAVPAAAAHASPPAAAQPEPAAPRTAAVFGVAAPRSAAPEAPAAPHEGEMDAAVTAPMIAAIRLDAALRRQALAGRLGPGLAQVAQAIDSELRAQSRPQAGELRLAGDRPDAEPVQLRLSGA